MALEFQETVSSTMDVARERVGSGQLTFDAKGTLRQSGVIAWEQTAGRGQRGRSWFAQPGESLCATYYVPTTQEQVGMLSLHMGVLLADTLSSLVETEFKPGLDSVPNTAIRQSQREVHASSISAVPGKPRVGLKWPNDLLLNGKKVGGVLIEMVPDANQRWIALIGVGINVRVQYLPSALAPFATSLHREGIPGIDVRDLGERIADALQPHRQQNGVIDFPAILDRWRAYDETQGRLFETILDGKTVRGTAEGIDEQGGLRLRLDEGRSVTVTSASSLTAR